MICLEELSTSGGKTVFTQTSCYHFFHWACIYSYVEHCRREFEESCNECKSTITPAAEEEVFEVCICMHAYTHADVLAMIFGIFLDLFAGPKSVQGIFVGIAGIAFQLFAQPAVSKWQLMYA